MSLGILYKILSNWKIKEKIERKIEQIGKEILTKGFPETNNIICLWLSNDSAFICDKGERPGQRSPIPPYLCIIIKKREIGKIQSLFLPFIQENHYLKSGYSPDLEYSRIHIL